MLDKRARALRDALRRLVVSHRALDDARRPCGTPLPTSHAWALLELREEGPMTVTTLSERLRIDRTNVSRLCARMEARGEIRRKPHPEDGRALLVELNAKGQRVAEAVDRSSTEHFLRVLAQLEADAGDVIEALDILSRALVAPDSQEKSA